MTTSRFFRFAANPRYGVNIRTETANPSFVIGWRLAALKCSIIEVQYQSRRRVYLGFRLVVAENLKASGEQNILLCPSS